MFESVPLRGEKCRTTPEIKVGSWYLLGVLFQISHELPVPYVLESTPSFLHYAAIENSPKIKGAVTLFIIQISYTVRIPIF